MSDDRVTAVPDLKDATWLREPLLGQVLSALSVSGGCVRIAGGAVRDALMGRPVREIDLAIDVPPDEVSRLAEAAGLKVVPTGIAHGTVTIIAGEGDASRSFEVTTLRVDIETFGRHARVAFGDDWVADTRRRDFTINALYCDADGTVFDPLGGYGDIIARRVRFVGDPGARIAEDYLRILRFFRFHAELGDGAPDRQGLSACIDNRDGLLQLSAERVRGELLRLLVASGAASTLAIMVDAGILDDVLGVTLKAARLELYFAIARGSGGGRDPLLALMSVLSDPASDTAEIARKLRLANRDQARLRCAASLVSGWASVPSGKTLHAAIYRRGTRCACDALLLSWVRSGDAPDDGRWRHALAFARTWRVPVFPVSGRDVRALGLAQGPAIGDILQELESRWIDEDFRPTEAELKRWLREAVDASAR